MKRVISLFVVLLVWLIGVLPVSAANGAVTYDGKSQSFIFAPGSDHSPTDLFPNFKDVMPGDSIEQPITVKNDASNGVKVKIYLRSLGAHEDSEAFLSQLHLRVAKSEENKMAYMFDAAADQTDGLTDWVCLGTLYSGGEVNLKVLLDVPVTMGNAFQQQIGYLDWQFKIDEYPIEDTVPVPPPTGYTVSGSAWIGMAIGLLGMTLFGLFLFRNKKEK
jgi:hypothetical protein